MLSALHGIGVIQLDREDSTDSQIMLPARERTDVDWATCNRLTEENSDFRQFMTLVRQFYQTGDLRPQDWDASVSPLGLQNLNQSPKKPVPAHPRFNLRNMGLRTSPSPIIRGIRQGWRPSLATGKSRAGDPSPQPSTHAPPLDAGGPSSAAARANEKLHRHRPRSVRAVATIWKQQAKNLLPLGRRSLNGKHTRRYPVMGQSLQKLRHIGKTAVDKTFQDIAPHRFNVFGCGITGHTPVDTCSATY